MWHVSVAPFLHCPAYPVRGNASASLMCLAFVLFSLLRALSVFVFLLGELFGVKRRPAGILTARNVFGGIERHLCDLKPYSLVSCAVWAGLSLQCYLRLWCDKMKNIRSREIPVWRYLLCFRVWRYVWGYSNDDGGRRFRFGSVMLAREEGRCLLVALGWV